MKEREPIQTETAAPAERKTRRRLTPEERIAERQDEIARIKAKQCDRVRERIAKAYEDLGLCLEAAKSAGMSEVVECCNEARRALLQVPQAEET